MQFLEGGGGGHLPQMPHPGSTTAKVRKQIPPTPEFEVFTLQTKLFPISFCGILSLFSEILTDWLTNSMTD